jgi:hypothetical protein
MAMAQHLVGGSHVVDALAVLGGLFLAAGAGRSLDPCHASYQ